MLSIEEIKICIEKFSPEGFVVKDRLYLTIKHDENTTSYLKVEGRKYLESLFLQRVIEGINRLGVKNLTLNQNNCGIYVYDNFNQETTNCYLLGYNDNSFDKCKEQAIKYILDKI